MSPEDLAHHLADLGIDRHSSKALALLPAVEVAWADGKVDASETELILRLADEHFHLGEEGARLLTDWLRFPPSDSYRERGYTALKALAKSGASGFDHDTLTSVIDLARNVAQASGGIGCLSYFRFRSISRKESSTLNAVTDRLAKKLVITETADEETARWSKRVTVMFDPDEDTSEEDHEVEMIGVLIVEVAGERRKLAVGDQGVAIGTAEAAKLRFEGHGVEPAHCRVFQRRRRFYVKDLSKKAGTYVNGERIGERRLLGGETIRLGEREIVFKMARKS